jgi:hypothetical protein
MPSGVASRSRPRTNGTSTVPFTEVAQVAKLIGARLFAGNTTRLSRSDMIVRHTILRAGLFEEATRLRYAHRALPLGVHRTRVSEIRPFRVRGPVGATRPDSLERTVAVRLPANTG